jgi:hypothetical protein
MVVVWSNFVQALKVQILQGIEIMLQMTKDMSMIRLSNRYKSLFKVCCCKLELGSAQLAIGLQFMPTPRWMETNIKCTHTYTLAILLHIYSSLINMRCLHILEVCKAIVDACIFNGQLKICRPIVFKIDQPVNTTFSNYY